MARSGEDFTSGWLSTFDNKNTCIFIVARRSKSEPSAKSNYGSRNVIDERLNFVPR